MLNRRKGRRSTSCGEAAASCLFLLVHCELIKIGELGDVFTPDETGRDVMPLGLLGKLEPKVSTAIVTEKTTGIMGNVIGGGLVYKLNKCMARGIEHYIKPRPLKLAESGYANQQNMVIT